MTALVFHFGVNERQVELRAGGNLDELLRSSAEVFTLEAMGFF